MDIISKVTSAFDALSGGQQLDESIIIGELKKLNKLDFLYLKSNLSSVPLSSLPIAVSFPSILVRILISSSTVHDSFLEAFVTSTKVLHVIENWTISSISTLLVNIWTGIAGIDLNILLNINRIELLFGCVRHSFDLAASSSINLEEQANISITNVISIQLKLKGVVQNTTGEKSMIKAIKEACSEVRNISIETVRSILICCPNTVKVNYELFWELSLKIFCTSKLFYPVYLILDSGNDEALISVKADYNNRVFNYLMTAISFYQRYSFPAALEIVQTLENLCDAKFVLLGDREHSCRFLSIMSAAYKGYPKVSPKDTEVYLWKVGLNVVMSKYFNVLQLMHQHMNFGESSSQHVENLDSFLSSLVVNFILLKQFLQSPQKGTGPSTPAPLAHLSPYQEINNLHQRASVRDLLHTCEPDAATEVLSSTIEALTKFLEYCSATQSTNNLSHTSGVGEAVVCLLEYCGRDLAHTSVVLFDDDAVRMCQEMHMLGATVVVVLCMSHSKERRQVVQVLALAAIRCLHNRLVKGEEGGGFDNVLQEVSREVLQSMKTGLSIMLVPENRTEAFDDQMITFIEKILVKLSNYV